MIKNIQKVNLSDKLKQFSDFWAPKIVGHLNSHKVQVAKFLGEFVWHKHKQSDEFFFVLKGRLIIHFREKTVTLNQGEMLIVPQGIEHKPEALEEAQVLLIEPKEVLNTGDAPKSDLTRPAKFL